MCTCIAVYPAAVGFCLVNGSHVKFIDLVNQ